MAMGNQQNTAQNDGDAGQHRDPTARDQIISALPQVAQHTGPISIVLPVPRRGRPVGKLFSIQIVIRVFAIVGTAPPPQ